MVCVKYVASANIVCFTMHDFIFLKQTFYVLELSVPSGILTNANLPK